MTLDKKIRNQKGRAWFLFNGVTGEYKAVAGSKAGLPTVSATGPTLRAVVDEIDWLIGKAARANRAGGA